jgi:hypothetical protein
LFLRKTIIRGALTSGRDWIFIIVKLNNDYNGASYRQSNVIQLNPTCDDYQPKNPTDLIAAILSYWVSLILTCVKINC